MTKKKSIDNEIETFENVSETDMLEASSKDSVKENVPKKYIYLGAALPNNALKSNTVFDGTFEDICEYLRVEIDRYPLVKELIIPVDRLAVSGTSSRISGLKKELLKSFERRK